MLAVRNYRYDAVRKRRLKTVELIEEEVPWLPTHGRLSRHTLVDIRVTADEYGIQRQVRQAGGTWDHQRKVWHITYEKVRELGLEERIVVPEYSDENGDRIPILYKMVPSYIR